MRWLRSLSREFSAGCLPQVMRLLAYSNAQRFACACAAACSPLPPICCDFLFLPRRKIGRPAARSATIVGLTRCAARCAWRENTAAPTKTEVSSLCLHEVRRFYFPRQKKTARWCSARGAIPGFPPFIYVTVNATVTVLVTPPDVPVIVRLVVPFLVPL